MATIDIMRATNGQGGARMQVVIRDGRKVVFKGALTMENFARAVTGVNEVPFMTDEETEHEGADRGPRHHGNH